MDPMSDYLARATIEARIAAAEAGRLGRQLERAGRAERRRRVRLAVTRWWQRRAARGFDLGSLALAVAAPERSPSAQLAHILDETAHRIAERGTDSERRVLEAMADVAAPSAPGAAAALADLAGTETSRLRAFGLLHSHLLEALGPRDHARLLDLLDGKDGLDAEDDDGDDADDGDLPCRAA
jgi:hypothetical protein